jgi:hypothetical protein
MNDLVGGRLEAFPNLEDSKFLEMRPQNIHVTSIFDSVCHSLHEWQCFLLRVCVDFK